MDLSTPRLNSALADLYSRRLSSDRREALVSEGAALGLERAGFARNERLTKANRAASDFGSAFSGTADLTRASRRWSDDVLYYCADKVRDFSAVSPDRNDRATFTRRELAANPLYLHTLSGILNDVVSTVTPALVSDLVGDLASVIYVPRGRTEEIEVQSNAVFTWYNSSWTSLRSVPADELYSGCITLNPRPRASKFTLNYYRMTSGSGSLTDTVYAISSGYAAALMDSFTTAFLAAAADTAYLPASLTATSYTDLNWATLCQNVAKANNVRRDSLIGYGSFMALRNVLPTNGSLASAIMTGMGDRYFSAGCLQSHDGVRLYEISPAVKPKTINTTLESVFPDDTIVIAARASDRYAPLVMGFEEDGDTSISLTPGDSVLADGVIEGIAVASYDIAPVFASRVGVMTNVVGS